MDRKEFLDIFNGVFLLLGRKITARYRSVETTFEIQGRIEEVKAISDIRETRRLEIKVYFKDPDAFPGIRHIEYYPDKDGRPNWETGISSGWYWYLVTDTGSYPLDAPRIADV